MLLREVHQNREYDHRDGDRGNARGEVGEERAFFDRLGFCDAVDSTGIKSTGKGFARRDGLCSLSPARARRFCVCFSGTQNGSKRRRFRLCVLDGITRRLATR